MPLSAVQKLLGLEGKIQSVKVSALTVPENDLSRKARANTDALDAEEYDRWYCTAYVSSISHQLEEAISGAIVRPIWQVAASEGVVIGKIQLLLAVVTLAALIAAAMGIASLMSTGIIERSKENWFNESVRRIPMANRVIVLLRSHYQCLNWWFAWLYCWLGLSKIYWFSTIWRTIEFCLDCNPLRINAVYFNCCSGYLVPCSSYCQTLPCGGALWPPIKVCFGV